MEVDMMTTNTPAVFQVSVTITSPVHTCDNVITAVILSSPTPDHRDQQNLFIL